MYFLCEGKTPRAYICSVENLVGGGSFQKGWGGHLKRGICSLKNHLYFPIPFLKMFTDMYVF